METNEIIYALSEEDIQNVALQELERKLTSNEIQKLIPIIEEKINWFEIIANAINENIRV